MGNSTRFTSAARPEKDNPVPKMFVISVWFSRVFTRLCFLQILMPGSKLRWTIVQPVGNNQDLASSFEAQSLDFIARRLSQNQKLGPSQTWHSPFFKLIGKRSQTLTNPCFLGESSRKTLVPSVFGTSATRLPSSTWAP